MSAKKPVCVRCSDTHRMRFRDGDAMCTHCPIPCRKCRDRKRPYCAVTPCPCECHTAEADK